MRNLKPTRFRFTGIERKRLRALWNSRALFYYGGRWHERHTFISGCSCMGLDFSLQVQLYLRFQNEAIHHQPLILCRRLSSSRWIPIFERFGSSAFYPCKNSHSERLVFFYYTPNISERKSVNIKKATICWDRAIIKYIKGSNFIKLLPFFISLVILNLTNITIFEI